MKHKLLVYSHTHCSGCKKAKEALNAAGVEYIELNVADNMLYFKNFVKLRESRPEFDAIKAVDRVGLPCIVIDDKEITFTLPENLEEWK